MRLNDGTAVVGDTDVAIMPGERVLIAGDFGFGQEHLGARHRRLVAVGRRLDRSEKGRQDVSAAATPLCADRHAAARCHLPGRGRKPKRGGRCRCLQARRHGASGRKARRGGAVGPDAVGRREAAPGIRPHPAAQPGYRRARRGNGRARSQEPGEADGVARRPPRASRCSASAIVPSSKRSTRARSSSSGAAAAPSSYAMWS